MTTESNRSQSTAASAFGTVSLLSEQLKTGHQAWLSRVKEAQAVEAAFAKELLASREPTEAVKVCNRWIAKRFELLAADASAFSSFWTNLDTITMNSSEIPAASTTKSADA